jgi:hypothetical protein
MATPRMDITSFVGKLLEQTTSKVSGCSPRR